MNKLKNSFKTITLLLFLITLVLNNTVFCIFASTNNPHYSKNLYYGFRLISQKDIPSIQSTVMQFTHIKSGAHLLFIQNKDDNKVFSINFRTPPSDNTGVNHIIEHSVLGGSKKFPVKDPFRDMNKQSLNTFLNAITTSDSTMYPIASKNLKDFKNLMSVYLDAVLYPNVLKNKNIFMQEGWHYEINSRNEPLKYNGIVFNEMKGSTSSPDNLLSQKINESLFPNSIYRWNAGGNPEDIVTLTYNKFKKTYKKYYTPSNSYIYLYGNLDINDTLKFINNSYLGKFKSNKKNSFSKISMQPNFKKSIQNTYEYPVLNNSQTKNKTYIASNYVIDKITNKNLCFAFNLIDQLLMGTYSSPLKAALCKNGFGTSTYGSLDLSKLQPTYSIIAENTSENETSKFKKIIDSVLNQIILTGFDKKLINSALNNYEINLNINNSSAERGLQYNNLVMQSWLYGGDPAMYLNSNSLLLTLKKNLKKGYLENLIKKYLIDNKNSSLVILKPKSNLNEKNSELVNKKLLQYKAALSQNQLNNLISENAALKKWQSEPDSKENEAKLPALLISDLNPKSDAIPTTQGNIKGIKVLNHNIFTNNICYINLYFDSSGVPQAKLPYLYLLSDILGRIDTKKYTYTNLSCLIPSYMGGLSFNTEAFNKYNSNKIYYPKMDISLSTTSNNLQKSFDILNEIINHSKFNNTLLLKQYIKQIRGSLEATINSEGEKIAIPCLLSRFSQSGKYSDMANLSFYNFICGLDANFSSKSKLVQRNLKEVSSMLFNKAGLIVGFAGSQDDYKKFCNAFSNFADKIKNKKLKLQHYGFNLSDKNQGLITSSKIQTVIKGYNFKNLGYSYNGSMLVLKNILNSEYLWSQVRIKGGAYGSAISISPNGNIFLYSYRDPNLKETLNVFDNSNIYLRNFNPSNAEMKNYIIGTIGNLDSPVNPCDKGRIADINYIISKTQKDIQNERTQVLLTKKKDIVNYSELLKKVTQKNCLCVIGNKEKIISNKNLFSSVKNIISK